MDVVDIGLRIKPKGKKRKICLRIPQQPRETGIALHPAGTYGPHVLGRARG